MRLKKQQALANLQTEVGELEAQNTTLISRLESLLNWVSFGAQVMQALSPAKQ